MVQGDLHDSCDAESVDVPHAEVLDAQALQEVAAGDKSDDSQQTEHQFKTFRQQELTALQGPRPSVRCTPDPVKTGTVSTTQSQEELVSGETKGGP